MQENSLEILKSLSDKIDQGEQKKIFPKRRSDYLFPDQQRFPMYPLQRWIDTYTHFSKSENLEKVEDPFDLIRAIIDYRDIYYAAEMDMLKSEAKIDDIGIFFYIKGSKIKSAILKKISELKRKISIRAKLLNDQANMTNLMTIEAEPVTKENDWEMRNIEGHIKKIQSIADNIDTSKTFKLREWDLERYGL